MNKIYVVDDSPSVCFAVESILGPKGYEVVVERTGNGALAKLEGEAPDLILCDLVLPDVDGFDICEFIRKSPALAPTPIVVISGIVDDEVKERAGELGIRDVLKKPFGAEELLKTVEEGLAQRAAASQAEAVGASSTVAESTPAVPSGSEAVESASPLTMPEDPAPAEVAQAEAAPPGPAFLRDLDSRIEVRFSMLMNAQGEVIQAVGPQKQGDLAKSLAAMVRQASEVSSQVGFDAVRDLTLEWDGGSLVMHPMADGQVLVLAPGERVGLGKARYLVRRVVREQAAGAL